MTQHYAFADLAQVNRWVGWLLLPPTVVTAIALLQVFYGNAMLTGFPPDLSLALLPPLQARLLGQADVLRLLQISLTLLFILFFCVCWLYLALRNLHALEGGTPRNLRNSLAIHVAIWANLAFALRMMRRLWRESSPEGHADRSRQWLVTWWWTVLIGANTCKVLALLELARPVLVSDWRLGNYWLLAAYAGYLALFVLTWRLVKRLEGLQRASWRQRSAVLAGADGG